jgi:hypothetical protein
MGKRVAAIGLLVLAVLCVRAHYVFGFLTSCGSNSSWNGVALWSTTLVGVFAFVAGLSLLIASVQTRKG